MIVLGLWHAPLPMRRFYFEPLLTAGIIKEKVYVSEGAPQENCLKFDWGYLGNFSLRWCLVKYRKVLMLRFGRFAGPEQKSKRSPYRSWRKPKRPAIA